MEVWPLQWGHDMQTSIEDRGYAHWQYRQERQELPSSGYWPSWQKMSHQQAAEVAGEGAAEGAAGDDVAALMTKTMTRP